MSKLHIRPTTVDDCALILHFIRELAIYEKAEEEVATDEDQLKESLFGETPKAYALISEVDGAPVGFAVYFFNYSTWLGKNGIYLEDLYVSPKFRGHGAGKALLKELSRIAVANDCGRVEWSVLDWNEPAIQFYRSLGARPKDGWTVYRLTGDALTSFAAD